MSYREKTPNTIGGVSAENRGRRDADGMDLETKRFANSPYEDGRVYNWNHREGWDEFYNRGYERGNRHHGGALRDHDLGHRGKGPKGYKRADDSIFHDVCDTLALNPVVDATDIDVSVSEGIVYLNGSVRDRRSKRSAEMAIENISGVHDVQNLLSIKKDGEGFH